MRTLLIPALVLAFMSLSAPLTVFACTTNADCSSGQTCEGGDNGGEGVCSASLTGGATNGGGDLTGGGNGGTQLLNPLQGGASLESFLNSILSFVIRIGAIIIVLMLVYVGYLFVVAQGSDSKLVEARKALLWTIVGALILLGAQAISLAIKATVDALSVGQ